MRWDDRADDQEHIARTRGVVASLAPWTGRGVYVNMLNFDEQDRVVEALGGPEKYAERPGSRPDTTRRTCSG